MLYATFVEDVPISLTEKPKYDNLVSDRCVLCSAEMDKTNDLSGVWSFFALEQVVRKIEHENFKAQFLGGGGINGTAASSCDTSFSIRTV